MPRSWLMSQLLFIPVARTEWTLTAWTCFQNSFLIPLSLGEEYGYCLPRVWPFSTHWLLQITSRTQNSAVDGKHFVYSYIQYIFLNCEIKCGTLLGIKGWRHQTWLLFSGSVVEASRSPGKQRHFLWLTFSFSTIRKQKSFIVVIVGKILLSPDYLL